MIESGPGLSRLHNMSAPPRMRLSLRALVREQRGGLFGLFGGKRPREDGINGMRCLGCSGFPGDRAEGSDPVSALLDVLGERGIRSGDGEEATDHLLTLLGGLDPAALGLPPFALAVSLSGSGQPSPWRAPDLTGPQAVALLSRTAGGVFLAARSPRLAVEEWLACRYAWFVPSRGGRP